ncbi:MAG: hypothetical protein P4N41_13445 [Negativicutes bacterium]|nr:hypothetical protein [Negativicutes bacterium]
MELNFQDYQEYAAKILEEEAIREIASQVRPLGKFRKNGTGSWEPVPYAGYTIVTPTAPDDGANAGTYQVLDEVREALLRELDFAGVVMAPYTALHMTVARLVSGDVFVKKVLKAREECLLIVLRRLFLKIARPGPLQYEIKGLSLFPQGVVAAMVSPVGPADYLGLQELRDRLYTDTVLKELGVDRSRGFKGHVSLCYIEEMLDENRKKELSDLIAAMNRRFFSAPLPFAITRAEVRKFEDFSRFYRQDNWPAFAL